MSQFGASTAINYRVHVRKHLVPFFGKYAMKDVTSELVQFFVSRAKVSPKTIRNVCITLQSMWRSARAWGYVTHDLMGGVMLPSPKRTQRHFFSAEEVKKIIEASPEPFRTFYGLAAETGLRAGELCGISLDALDMERRLLFEMLRVALENAINCEADGMQERQLYWLRCAMLAQDEMTRRRQCA